MRRIPFPSAALAAGLVILLTGCAGETPTSPTSKPVPPNGGTCTVSIAMVATSQSPVAGSEVVVRAAVTKAGAAVPDGTSVQLTTDLGVFAENGLQTVSKTTLNGAADVTLFGSNPGPAHVKATFECATSTITVTFSGVANQGPFISSFTPQSGSCAGGDTVDISGGQFGATAGSVFFGGAPASVVNWAINSITVTTPIHTMQDPLKPEQVNLVVQTAGNQSSQPVTFTYFCVAQRMTISSISPVAGSPGGGDSVAILGSHFGSTTATTQVTFCGLPAQITGQARQRHQRHDPRPRAREPGALRDLSGRRDARPRAHLDAVRDVADPVRLPGQRRDGRVQHGPDVLRLEHHAEHGVAGRRHDRDRHGQRLPDERRAPQGRLRREPRLGPRQPRRARPSRSPRRAASSPTRTCPRPSTSS